MTRPTNHRTFRSRDSNHLGNEIASIVIDAGRCRVRRDRIAAIIQPKARVGVVHCVIFIVHDHPLAQ